MAELVAAIRTKILCLIVIPLIIRANTYEFIFNIYFCVIHE